ncbi:MAG TPA: Rrf2 family transcriptional regulator [Caulobacteraceae bacterium]|jgi:Rrf2 family protein|nr:Rrf2 family transcriptional regulator [Caulobacteraceae bacterium]
MLSQRCKYALKAMVDLARASGGPRRVSDIAEQENIPRKFLEAIMTDLKKGLVVDSTRGKFGGYRLSRPSDLITFGEIIRLIDGPLALLPCASQNFYRPCDDCEDEITCVLRRVLIDARNELAAVLDRTTLAAALAAPPQSQFAAAILAEDSPIPVG